MLHVDAAENGVGGFWNGNDGNPGTRWCRTPLPKGVTLAWERGGNGFTRDGRRSVSSVFCEAAALLGALLTFLPIFVRENPHRLLQHGVLVFSDSSVVVDVWNKKHPSVTFLPYLRAFTHIGAFFNVKLLVRHIDGISNSTADSVSRGQMARFRELQPMASALPLPMPSEEAFFLLQPAKDYSREL